MRGDIRHLNPVNVVVSFYHMVKSMLPMHRHQGKPLFIRKQKSCVSVHHSLIPWCFPVLDDGLETPEYVFGHRQLPIFALPDVSLLHQFLSLLFRKPCPHSSTILPDNCPVFHSHTLQTVFPSLLNYVLHDTHQKHYSKQPDL